MKRWFIGDLGKLEKGKLAVCCNKSISKREFELLETLWKILQRVAIKGKVV